MTTKRFTIKPQDDLFGVVDNYSADKICVINGIRTEIEAEWLCTDMNTLNDENEQLKKQDKINEDCYKKLLQKYDDLKKENEQLKQTIRTLGDFRNFITEKNVSNEKQRKELQLQMLRLYNYFENLFEDTTMSPNAFSEMWDNVKEDKKWEKKWYE